MSDEILGFERRKVVLTLAASVVLAAGAEWVVIGLSAAAASIAVLAGAGEGDRELPETPLEQG